MSLTLSELSAEVTEPLRIRVYADVVPAWALIALAFVAVAMAVLVDACRRRGEHEGLMGALTVAGLAAGWVFCRSTVRTPGLPQLVVAALAGVVAGAAAGMPLSRLVAPVRRLLPQSPV